MDESERVTRALELALADYGIAFDPVDDVGPVGEMLARYLAGTGEAPRYTLKEVAAWIEDEVDHEDAWWFADLLRDQAQGESDGE